MAKGLINVGTGADGLFQASVACEATRTGQSRQAVFVEGTFVACEATGGGRGALNRGFEGPVSRVRRQKSAKAAWNAASRACCRLGGDQPLTGPDAIGNQMAPPAGFEPATLRLEGACSVH